MLPIGRVRTQMNIRYYLYAILFLVFDAEAVFLFPWAVSFVGVGKAAFFEMVLFLAVLAAGSSTPGRRERWSGGRRDGQGRGGDAAAAR